MNGSRTVALALLALLMSAGCRTAGVGNLAQSEPKLPRASSTARELVAELNRNAERVETFEATPSITAYFPEGGGGGANGRLAFARPRNFKLVMSAAMQDIADIGSNDDEFWFWMKNKDRKEKKSIYYCKYDETGQSPLTGMLQPDWIVESLGFRVIPPEEAETITVKPGKDPGTLVMDHPAGTGVGVARNFRRETVLSEATHHILEHRVYSAKNVLLARATIADRDYRSLPVGADGQGEKVNLPTKLRLEWFQESQQNLKLEVVLNQPQVNTKFDAERRAALFVEPPKKGERVNLAELAGATAEDKGSNVRNTRPVPPAGVRLGDPAPLGGDEARVPPRDPVALTADLGTFPGELAPPPLPDVLATGPVGSDAYAPPPAGYER
ncbi:MAG: hypothetical protein P4L84_01200 [Isosphaeraceae bacterium]|nr:hypothetical protein [Isosphaeraceae bacterium]